MYLEIKALALFQVGFDEGDEIIGEPDPVDEGWMLGTVKRTGMKGLLPSNYVQVSNS